MLRTVPPVSLSNWKALNSQSSSVPQVPRRVEDITDYATSLGCDLTLKPDADYQALIDALPR